MSEWYEELTVQNKAVKFQLDTGAKCNVLPHKVIEDLGIQCHVEKSQITLKSYSGHQIPTRGVVTLPCEHKGNAYNVQFHVAEVEAPAVLSAQTCKEMGLLARIHQLQDSQPKEQHCIPECLTVTNQNILNEYSDLFQGLGCILDDTQSKKTQVFLQWFIHLEKSQCLLKTRSKTNLTVWSR